jgi:hypothetical protein
MPAEHDPAPAEPDDLDRQLRDLTSGVAEAPRFTEPSAAERARLAAKRAGGRPSGARAARPAGSATRRAKGWRSARRARELRRPVQEPGQPGQPRPIRRNTGAAAGRPAFRSRRSRRLRSAAKMTGIVVGFIALLLVLHMLGFGPQ